MRVLFVVPADAIGRLVALGMIPVIAVGVVLAPTILLALLAYELSSLPYGRVLACLIITAAFSLWFALIWRQHKHPVARVLLAAGLAGIIGLMGLRYYEAQRSNGAFVATSANAVHITPAPSHAITARRGS